MQRGRRGEDTAAPVAFATHTGVVRDYLARGPACFCLLRPDWPQHLNNHLALSAAVLLDAALGPGIWIWTIQTCPHCWISFLHWDSGMANLDHEGCFRSSIQKVLEANPLKNAHTAVISDIQMKAPNLTSIFDHRFCKNKYTRMLQGNMRITSNILLKYVILFKIANINL